MGGALQATEITLDATLLCEVGIGSVAYSLFFGLEVAKPPVAALVFEAAEPRAGRIEAEDDGYPYGVDDWEGVAPIIQMGEEDDGRGDPEVPVCADGDSDAEGKGVDDEDVQDIEEERYASVDVEEGADPGEAGLLDEIVDESEE